MQEKLQRRFEQIEAQRAALQAVVLALTDAQLGWTARAGTWSVRQIVQHLVLSDETVGHAREPGETQAEDRMFRVLTRAVRRRLVLSAFARNLALPLPSPGVEPREDTPLPALLVRWDRARGEMSGVLNTLRGDETRWSHPVLGPLTATQMLDLEQAHVAYHRQQMETVQRLPAFPGRVAA